jgi:hypothetical protein
MIREKGCSHANKDFDPGLFLEDDSFEVKMRRTPSLQFEMKH